MFMVVPQAWTVGTELWFYLLAPFLVRRTKRIVAVMALAIALRLVMIHVYHLDFMPWNYCFFPAEIPFFLSGALGFKAYHHVLQGKNIPLRRLGPVAFFRDAVLDPRLLQDPLAMDSLYEPVA